MMPYWKPLLYSAAGATIMALGAIAAETTPYWWLLCPSTLIGWAVIVYPMVRSKS